MLLIPNNNRNTCLTIKSCLVEDLLFRKLRNGLYIEQGRQNVILEGTRAMESDTVLNYGSSNYWQCNFGQVIQP